MLAYGHRGFSGVYPENTMLAFTKAVEEAKVDGIELDVHLTKDDQLVIIHDETVDRTTNGSGYVKDLTLEELKTLNAPAKFGDKYSRTEIPCFEEYCEYISDKDIITNIELKTNLIYYRDIEEKVYKTLKRFDLLDRVIISSFNHCSILMTKEIDESIPCGFLVESQGLINAGYYAAKQGVDYYHPDITTLTNEQVRNCNENGVGINVWTVNSLEELKKSVDFKVNGIISNFPDIVKEYLKVRGVN